MDPADWQARAEAVTDAELTDFRRRICVVGGHIGLCALGTCSRCGGVTSSCSMSICRRCADELGVCPFDQLMTGWGSVSAPEGEAMAVLWLALLMRGYSVERAVAVRALQSFPLAGVTEAVRGVEQRPGSMTRSPVAAEFIVGFHGRLPDGVEAGRAFLNGTVVRVDGVLGFAVVRTGDAARFEALAAEDARVRYVELNR
jgi:hypothetical protein